MYRRSLLALSSILVIGLLLTVLASSGASAATGCNNHSLQGSYGFAISGSIFNNKGNEQGDLTVGGRFTFNGQGAFVGAETDSFNGQAAAVTETGTYTLNTDCTGTATFLQSNNNTVHLNIVVVDNTHQIKVIDIDPGVSLAGTLVKQ